MKTDFSCLWQVLFSVSFDVEGKRPHSFGGEKEDETPVEPEKVEGETRPSDGWLRFIGQTPQNVEAKPVSTSEAAEDESDDIFKYTDEVEEENICI